MKYVDGFVLAVPKRKLPAYRKMAQKREKFGGRMVPLSIFECVGDDLNPKLTGIKFPRTVRARPARPSCSRLSHSGRGRIAIASTPK